jgi:hypothetical protein
LPLAKIVRTFVNPASSNALATSVILRLTPPTLTPRRKAAYRVMPFIVDADAGRNVLCLFAKSCISDRNDDGSVGLPMYRDGGETIHR